MRCGLRTARRHQTRHSVSKLPANPNTVEAGQQDKLPTPLNKLIPLLLNLFTSAAYNGMGAVDANSAALA